MTTFISAPFGNYLKFKNAVSVTGTWTYKPRPGLFGQVVKTLRYTKDGWRNKIGLRNPPVQNLFGQSRACCRSDSRVIY